MTISYVYTKADNTLATRTDSSTNPATVSFIPWDTVNNQPIDIHGLVGRVWQQDGSIAPSAYVAPPVTSNIIGFINFTDLFTQAEALAISYPDGLSPALPVQTIAQIKLIGMQASSAGPALDLMDPRVIAGVQALTQLLPASVGFTSERAAAVLANQPPPTS